MLPGMRGDGETAGVGAALRSRAGSALQGVRVLATAAVEIDFATDASPGSSARTNVARTVGRGWHSAR